MKRKSTSVSKLYNFIFLIMLLVPTIVIIITEHYILPRQEVLVDHYLLQTTTSSSVGKANEFYKKNDQRHPSSILSPQLPAAPLVQTKAGESIGAFQTIDRIYYINMNKRKDKRDFMESWLKPFSEKYSIPYQRISAQSRYQHKCEHVRISETPRCRAGKALKYTNFHIMDNFNTTGYTLVLEDDFQIKYYEKLLDFMRKVPDDWDVIRFDCWTGPYGVDPKEEFEQLEFGYRTVTPSKKWFCGGTHATLWRSDRLHILRNIWENPRTHNEAIDCMLANDNIVSYCVQADVGNLENQKLSSDME